MYVFYPLQKYRRQRRYSLGAEADFAEGNGSPNSRKNFISKDVTDVNDDFFLFFLQLLNVFSLYIKEVEVLHYNEIT